MNRTAPQDVWRSEAFAEDLFDDAPGVERWQAQRPLLSHLLLCAVPVVVALLGGVATFFHTVG